MLKIWLLNLLYENCISALFESLHTNFITTLVLYKIGDSFNAIYVCYDNWDIEAPYEIEFVNAIIVDKQGDLLHIEYDVMSVMSGLNNTTTNITIRDIDKAHISDITRIKL